jgi:NAD(P)-dependent dehydrogenase (short-subunit alcohol dehydrogenase family)
MTDPRAVWVTGAASGMGASHARRFAAMGDRVGMWDVQADELGTVAAEVRTDGGSAETVVADITDWEAVQAAAHELREKLGPAQVVVANAGIIADGAHIDELDPVDWQRVIDVNLTGAFHTAKAAVPQLREAEGDRSLVLISSICGLTASQGFGAYNASKHGVIGLMRTLANELGPDGITVNAICPGWVKTPMLGASVDDAGGESADLSEFTAMSLIERLIEPEEVTEAVVWLTSPAGRAVTGVALPVDLGLMEKRAWPQGAE